jgi:phage terminase large subunit-like protein
VRNLRVKVTDSLMRRVLQSGRPIVLDHGDLLKIKTSSPVKAIISVPLIIGGHAIGVLSAYSLRLERHFREHEVHLLSTLADSAAIAIRNADLYHDVRRVADRFAALAEIDRHISESLDLHTVLERIVTHARELLKAADSEVYLLDEAGQFVEAENEYISMLRSSQGSYEDAVLFIVSTQAPSDQSFLSLEIDSSIREDSPKTVTHVYAADPECDIMDERQWYYSNPGLGKYRSVNDLKEQLSDAIKLPAKMPGVMNLLLNMRVAQESLFISPEVWKQNSGKPELDVFRNSSYVTAGLDLSTVNDLTSCVLTAQDDDGIIHVMVFAFSPLGGIEARSQRDKVPYAEWARTEVIYAPPGDTLNYELICQYLRIELQRLGITVHEVHFDRYRIDVFKAAAQREGFATGAQFIECGMGFVSMGPRMDALETALLQRKVRHGSNQVLNLGASNCVVEIDNVGNRRPTKKKSAQKIDALVALLMSIYPHVAPTALEIDVSALIA